METKQKHAGGRPPVTPEERKSVHFAFRVTPDEKEMLNLVGEENEWRILNISIAHALVNLEKLDRWNVPLGYEVPLIEMFMHSPTGEPMGIKVVAVKTERSKPKVEL